MITDRYIEKDGLKIEKVKLLYVDGDEKLCDGCDEFKKCATISDMLDNYMVICKDCLQEIIDKFNK